MKKPIDDLNAVTRVITTRLNSPGATALRTAGPWTYAPPRRVLRRRQSVNFPHPHTIDLVDDAERWACLAEDVAAETKTDLTIALLVFAVLLSLTTLPLSLTLSTIDMDPASRAGAQAVAAVIAVGAILAMVFFARGAQQAPVWERRAVALRLRVHELAAAQVRSDEQERRGASPPRSWWRGRRR